MKRSSRALTSVVPTSPLTPPEICAYLEKQAREEQAVAVAFRRSKEMALRSREAIKKRGMGKWWWDHRPGSPDCTIKKARAFTAGAELDPDLIRQYGGGDLRQLMTYLTCFVRLKVAPEDLLGEPSVQMVPEDDAEPKTDAPDDATAGDVQLATLTRNAERMRQDRRGKGPNGKHAGFGRKKKGNTSFGSTDV